MLKANTSLDWSSNAHDQLVSHGWKIAKSPKDVTVGSGLYALFEAEKGKCLYVGRSSNVKVRMSNNGKWQRAKKDFESPVIYFCEIPNHNADDIFYLECLAIGLLKPEWNFSQSEARVHRSLRAEENYLTDKDCVFLSCRGRQIERTTVHNIFKNCASKAGISKTASFITLRNSYGLEMLKRGVDIKTISESLGTKAFRAIRGRYFIGEQNQTFVQ